MDRKKPRVSEHMIARARKLRQDSSTPERLLWRRLRNRRCGGMKFRRQYAIGAYVADFYCDSAGIVIELDGRSHDGQEDADQRRQEYLESRGLRVIRVSNDRLLADLDGVAEAIAEICTKSR